MDNAKSGKGGLLKAVQKETSRNYDLYLMILPAMVMLFIFSYAPMYGLQIAFKDFQPGLGIWGSKWVGFEHFQRFFNAFNFPRIMRNTIVLSVYGLLVNFPLTIVFAIMINEVGKKWFKKTVQMVSYAPYFISTVVLVGMIQVFFHQRTGLVNIVLERLGLESVKYLTSAKAFPHLYVWSGLWQGIGFSAVIYIAALSGIDPQLHEAAIIDGASKMQRIWNVDLPGIMPTATIMLIMNMGHILNIGFEKVYLLQNPLNLETSQIISTHVYEVGIQGMEYSFSAAIGLFQSVINLVLLISVNTVCKKLSETSLW